jgi:branched-chain amino acid transport system substrate-binding protein
MGWCIDGISSNWPIESGLTHIGDPRGAAVTRRQYGLPKEKEKEMMRKQTIRWFGKGVLVDPRGAAVTRQYGLPKRNEEKMMRKQTIRWFGKGVFLLTAVLGLSLANVSNARSETVYNFSASTDFTGPYANAMASMHGGRVAIVNWWNDTRGKALGVRIALKPYDMRYDPSVVAQVWPSILSGDKPLVHLGIGAPDLNALMKRLPNDKVLLINGAAIVGTVWVSNGWHFAPRPTYSHEFAGLFEYLYRKLPEKRPLRIGTVSTQSISGYVDIVNGVVMLAKTYPDRFKIVESVWVDAQPISVTNEVRRIAKENPDVILTANNTAQVVATIKALKELGLKTPVVTGPHNGLDEVAKAIPLQDLEGSYSAFSFTPYMEKSAKGAEEIFNKYNTSKGVWGSAALQPGIGALLAVRVLERAISRVGPTKVTGQAMYDALMAGEFPESEFLGLLPSLRFTKDAPFPTGDIKVKAMTVRDGKIVSLTDAWLPVPALPKW